MKKDDKPPFPNEQFETQMDYAEFVKHNHVAGKAAYDLKKQMDKPERIIKRSIHIPEPDILNENS